MTITLQPQPLTKERFAPYGDVIESVVENKASMNELRFERFDDLARVEMTDEGRVAVSIARCRVATELPYRIDMIESYLNMICWQANEGPMPVAEISKAKFSASKAMEFCASEAMQVLGGAGYLRGNPVERIYREVKVQAEDGVSYTEIAKVIDICTGLDLTGITLSPVAAGT